MISSHRSASVILLGKEREFQRKWAISSKRAPSSASARRRRRGLRRPGLHGRESQARHRGRRLAEGPSRALTAARRTSESSQHLCCCRPRVADCLTGGAVQGVVSRSLACPRAARPVRRLALHLPGPAQSGMPLSNMPDQLHWNRRTRRNSWDQIRENGCIMVVGGLYTQIVYGAQGAERPEPSRRRVAPSFSASSSS
jgi:hypothetical protein